MDLKKIQEKIKEVRKNSKKRGFDQTFDMIINLQNIDLKKPEHKVDVGIVLPVNTKPKKLKICAVIDHSITGVENILEGVVYNTELAEMKGDMEKIRKIIHKYDKFIVQMNYMPLFAQVLGRYLGPMGKMPSPKLGMIINPKTDIKALSEKLNKTVHLQTKKNLVLQAAIGSEAEKDEVIAENINKVMDTLLHALPNKNHNIKNIGIKLTMSKLEVL